MTGYTDLHLAKCLSEDAQSRRPSAPASNNATLSRASQPQTGLRQRTHRAPRFGRAVVLAVLLGSVSFGGDAMAQVVVSGQGGGTTGGGAGAGGDAGDTSGAAGSPSTDGNGGKGGDTVGGVGGNGGSRGDLTNSALMNGTPISGANGGVGADGSFGGAGGGGGGAGLFVSGTSVAVTNTSQITGGEGGRGGDGDRRASGGGGGGGNGIIFSPGGSLNNSSAITGGDGGNSGNTETGGNAQGGGGGGHGVVGAGLAIVNTGTITGGRGGVSGTSPTPGQPGTNGAAILFTGNTNTLTLGTRSVLNGAVETVTGAETTISTAVDGLNLSGGTLGNPALINNGAVTVEVGGGVGLGVSGRIIGSGGLTKQGTGTLTLSGTNSFSGGLAINAGVVSVANIQGVNTALGANTGRVTVASGAALELTGSGSNDNPFTISGTGTGSGAIVMSGGNSSLDGAITLADDAMIGVYTGPLNIGGTITLSSHDLTFAGGQTKFVSAAIGGGTGSVINTAGDLLLDGTNTYTGKTVVNGGRIILRNGSAIHNDGVVEVNMGTLIIETSETIGSLSGAGNLAFSPSRTLTTGGNNASTTFSGNASGPDGALIKQGTGTFTMTGTNTYTGTTTISAGTLQIGNGGTTGTLGTGSVVNNGTLTFNRSDSVIVGQVISGSGGVVKQGTGTLTLTGTNTYSGTTTISAGTLRIGNGGTTSTLGRGNVVNNGTLRLSRSDPFTVTNSISGSGGIIVGTSRADLSGTNTYEGDTVINGWLIVSGGSAIGDQSTVRLSGNARMTVRDSETIGALAGSGGSVSVLNTKTLTVGANNTSTTYSGRISGGGGALTKIGTGTLTLTGEYEHTGTTTISAGTLEIGNGGTTGTFRDSNFVNNATLTFNRSDSVTVGQVISGSGSVVKQGTGTLTLTGTNTYSGTTTISAGTLRIGNGGTLGTGNVINNGTLTVSRSGSVTLAQVISGSGSVVKQGTGTLTLSGTNSFSGGLAINAGVVRVANIQGVNTALGANTGRVTVASGAALELTGSGTNDNPFTISGTGTGSGAIVMSGGNSSLNGAITLADDAMIGV